MPEHTPLADAKAGQETAEAINANAGQGNGTDAKGQVEFLKMLGEVGGREYKDVEDAKKHISGLVKLVGDNTVAAQRKRAELADTLVARIASENGWDKSQAEQYLLNLTTQQTMETQNPVAPQTDPKIEERLRRGERAEFLLETPEAKPYIEKIESFARATGKTNAEAYAELYGDIVKKDSERKAAEDLEKEKREASVSASHDSTPVKLPDEYDKAMKEYRKTGKSEHLQAAIKIRNKTGLGIK